MPFYERTRKKQNTESYRDGKFKVTVLSLGILERTQITFFKLSSLIANSIPNDLLVIIIKTLIGEPESTRDENPKSPKYLRE